MTVGGSGERGLTLPDSPVPRSNSLTSCLCTYSSISAVPISHGLMLMIRRSKSIQLSTSPCSSPPHLSPSCTSAAACTHLPGVPFSPVPAAPTSLFPGATVVALDLAALYLSSTSCLDLLATHPICLRSCRCGGGEGRGRGARKRLD
jgi:hypothetical protein